MCYHNEIMARVTGMVTRAGGRVGGWRVLPRRYLPISIYFPFFLFGYLVDIFFLFSDCFWHFPQLYYRRSFGNGRSLTVGIIETDGEANERSRR